MQAIVVQFRERLPQNTYYLLELLQVLWAPNLPDPGRLFLELHISTASGRRVGNESHGVAVQCVRTRSSVPFTPASMDRNVMS